MPRTPLIAGNWKMHKTVQETVDFCRALKEEVAAYGAQGVEVAVAPPFTAIHAAVQVLQGTPIAVSSQDVFWAESGAFTGEVSPGMLKEAGCRLAIVGHSERRQYFFETDDSVNKKAAAVIKAGLVPIFCLGESLSEREQGVTFPVVEKQARQGLRGLAVKDPLELVMAYEPVWAIGTGKTATPEQAQEVHSFIRKLLGEIFSPPVARGVRLLYGGSVKADNIAELMAMEDVDGALVGGASLEVASFSKIVKGALK